MEPVERAILEARCFSDIGADIDLSTLPEEEKEQLGVELAKLEDEIATLRQVLIAKEKHLVEIKQKMGITPLNEIKHNLRKSWHDMQTSVIYCDEMLVFGYEPRADYTVIKPQLHGNRSSVNKSADSLQTFRRELDQLLKEAGTAAYKSYKKTQVSLNNTGQKASAALNNVSSTLSKKLGEMKNSPTFKSFEERMETTVSSLKCKVGAPAHSSGSFEDVLNSTANASVQVSTSGNRPTEDFGAF